MKKVYLLPLGIAICLSCTTVEKVVLPSIDELVVEAADEAVSLLRRAKRKKESITVLGVLNNDGIDIEIFSYDGISVRPYGVWKMRGSSPSQ